MIYTSPRTASAIGECLGCSVTNGTRLQTPRCEPNITFAGTNATAVGGGYLVQPGKTYYIDVLIDGNVPASMMNPYEVELVISPSTPDVSVLPPNPQDITTYIPPSAMLTYHISVSPSAFRQQYSRRCL